jgi:multicomponent Na+:H+ antiporter subunit E
MRRLYIFVALFICYYIFSGNNEPFFLAAGVVSALMGLWLAHKIKFFDNYPSLGWRFLCYLPWLGKEVIKSTIDVLKLIWSRHPNISSGFILIKTRQRTPLGYTLFGNSITLTPGTVSVDLNENLEEILVHGLTVETRAALQTGEMDAKVLEALK